MIKCLPEWSQIRKWWATPLGQSFIEQEKSEVSKIIPTLFGYHLLVLGAASFKSCVQKSPITHRVWINPEIDVDLDPASIIARHDKLPVYSDSIDVVYLAHVLEYVSNPHEVLREVFRSLIPEGHLIISTFMPCSLWGLWRWFTRFICRSPWDGHFISEHRLADWLVLLGFDVVQRIPYYFRPPINNPNVLQHLKPLEKFGRWMWPFFSSGSLIVARKRLITVTPIRPTFKEKTEAITTPVVEPVVSQQKIINKC